MYTQSNKQNLKQKTIKGFLWRFGERILSQLVSFVVSIVLARLLLPQEYGTIALCMVFINVISVLAVSGLGTSLVQKKDADELDFSTLFWAGMGMSVFLYMVLFFLAPVISQVYQDEKVCSIFRVLGLVIPIQALNSIQQASVSRKMEFKKFFYATTIGTILSGFIGVAMAYLGYGVWALVGQQLSNNIINAFVLNRIIEWRPQLHFSITRFKSLFSFGACLMGATFFGTLLNELKSFIVGVRYTPADLAFYNRGDSFPKLIGNNVNNTIIAVIFPAISQVQGNLDEVKRAMRRSMTTSSYIMSPILFWLAATADSIVKILLTDKWLPCVPYMRVLCLSYCISILTTANLQSINAIGRSDMTLKLEFYKKPFYLLAIIIGMFISPLAIAVANTLYMVVELIINAIPNKRLINYSFAEQLSDVAPQFILSLVMATIVYFIGLLNWNVWLTLALQGVTGVTIYWLGSIQFSLESYNYILSSINTFKHQRSIEIK